VSNKELPAPLPPETRTVGQLVAETLKLYGSHFWVALAIGAGPALVGVLNAELDGWPRLVVVPTLGSLLWGGAYALAAGVATGKRPTRIALLLSVLVVLPFLLQRTFVLPGFDLPVLAIFALTGLAVPAAVAEGLGLWTAIRRGVQLARADYVHALGSLATLVIVIFLTGLMLFFFLQDFGDSTIRVAAFLALLVLSPLFLLGAALLYVDQAARVSRASSRKRSAGGVKGTSRA
jgi:hypothetical protein